MASPSTEDLQRAKEIVQSYHNALALEEGANEERVKEALKTHYLPEVRVQFQVIYSYETVSKIRVM